MPEDRSGIALMLDTLAMRTPPVDVREHGNAVASDLYRACRPLASPIPVSVPNEEADRYGRLFAELAWDHRLPMSVFINHVCQTLIAREGRLLERRLRGPSMRDLIESCPRGSLDPAAAFQGQMETLDRAVAGGPPYQVRRRFVVHLRTSSFPPEVMYVFAEGKFPDLQDRMFLGAVWGVRPHPEVEALIRQCVPVSM